MLLEIISLLSIEIWKSIKKGNTTQGLLKNGKKEEGI